MPLKRRLRWPLIAAAVMLPLLLGAAFTLPGRIDWDGYREGLAQNAGERLGRPIGLNGGLRLRLLPETLLEADGLTIGTAADGVELSARALRLRLDPWWLLVGHVVVRELVLVGADIQLPWPPAQLPALGGLTSLDARLEDSRVRIAGASIEGVSARLLAGGPTDALLVDGRINWRGQPLSFTASLGRAGEEGIAPLQIVAQASGSRITARGVLLAEGAFEGRLDAAGQDLAALLPTPHGAFTASGRISATAELLGVDQLALELAGQSARGGISLRLTPPARGNGTAPAGPRLDAALLASRLDLDAWTEALRHAGTPALPIGLDLSAETAELRGTALRRLRLAVQLENGRILIPEASAVLPGEARIDASGAGTANASEWALRFQARNLPEALAAFGALRLPAGVVPPGPASGTLKLVLDERQAAFSEIAASLDGQRVAGTATWRWGERPVLGLGLEVARLDLDPWLAGGDMLAGLDINLRLAAERATWRGLVLEAVNIDAAAEAGRLVLRRGLARLAGADLTASASGTLAPPRIQEGVVEAQGASTGALLAPWLEVPPPFAALPARLRATVAGPPEALAVRVDLAMEDARLEGQLTVDAPQSRAAGSWTLRHPGATRLLGEVLGARGRDWLGDGSLAVIANGNWRAGVLTAENLDLVAGGVRLQGALALSLEQRPRLTGTLTGESWPLPVSPATLSLMPLSGFDMEMELRAGRWVGAGLPVLEEPRATLRLEAGQLALELVEGRLSGGALRGVLRLDARIEPPAWSLDAGLDDSQVTAPLLGGAALDVATGQLDARLSLRARGHGPAEWRQSLAGDGQIVLRDGALIGVDMAALNQALAARASPDAAWAGGTTPFTRLTLPFTAASGLFRLGAAGMESVTGSAVPSGDYDAVRDTIEWRLAFPQPAGPEVALRFTGPLDMPRRVAETGALPRERGEGGTTDGRP